MLLPLELPRFKEVKAYPHCASSAVIYAFFEIQGSKYFNSFQGIADGYRRLGALSAPSLGNRQLTEHLTTVERCY
jgi:hypothetical protein